MIKETVNKHGIDVYSSGERAAGKSRLEWVEGVDLYQHFCKENPELKPVFFHVANESNSKAQYRQKLKQQGLTSGVSDYLLLTPRGDYCYMAIELKRAKKSDSSVSKQQVNFLLETTKHGGYSCVCYGYKAALFAINKYLLLD